MSAPTRRAVLGAIASAPAFAASCAPQPAAAFACVASLDRSDWDAKMAHLEEIKRQSAEHTLMYRRVQAARKKGAPSEDMIDWSAFPFAHRDHVLHSLDVDGEQAAFLAAEGKSWWGDKAKAARLAAYDQVRQWRAAAKANDDLHDWDRINDESDAFGDAWVDAEVELLATPAPDLESLAWKIEHLLDTGGTGDPHSTSSWSADYLGTTMADVRRLLRGEG